MVPRITTIAGAGVYLTNSRSQDHSAMVYHLAIAVVTPLTTQLIVHNLTCLRWRLLYTLIMRVLYPHHYSVFVLSAVLNCIFFAMLQFIATLYNMAGHPKLNLKQLQAFVSSDNLQ
jgi:hypothetical protein